MSDMADALLTAYCEIEHLKGQVRLLQASSAKYQWLVEQFKPVADPDAYGYFYWRAPEIRTYTCNREELDRQIELDAPA